jgi:protein-S-isoprenylcysteine O-methyltransferase Ste14
MADLAPSRRRVADVLARKRVALGFIASAATLALARPTWSSWRLGLAVAVVGEAIRVWAAGHLEKSREVTRTGPYRFSRHPLYVGSSIVAVGAVIAARSPVAAAVAAVYMVATLTAAIQTEEAFLRGAFGATYDEYRAARAEPMARRFSWARAMRNREYRAMAGLTIGFALLALRILVPV